jgi:ParB family chromosome partitioning protein
MLITTFAVKKLLAAKDIIEKRKVLGKNVHIGGNPSKNLKGSPKLTGEDLLRIYQKEVDRKQMLTRKADFANNRLNFVVGALRKLLKEDNFNTLLKAEGLNTIPKQLAELIGKK